MSAEVPIVQVVDIADKISSNYLTYAEYVLRNRAVPDARDGLKPIHRRILWAMWTMGCRSKNPHRKSARIVGDVVGKYHPHGDSAAYEAMVRLAQPFALNDVLVDGKGNFGSVDNPKGFAAHRYTEARLSEFAEVVYFADIEEETVEFAYNYDGSEKEPVVLPARLPMLLCTSPSGIAVGMATDIPPHNLSEVCDTVLAYLEDTEMDSKGLAAALQGPDFALGGLINVLERDEVYATGHGKFDYRSIVEFESDRKHKAVVVRTVPPGVPKEVLIKEIADGVLKGKIGGVRGIRDESGKEGIRVWIEVDPSASHEDVLESLYAKTRLQSAVRMNAVVILDGAPVVVSLKTVMEQFIAFRREVVKRRAIHRRTRAATRREIVEGILKAAENPRGVMDIVCQGKKPEATIERLGREVGLTKTQAEHVYAMPVRRFSILERSKLVSERKELDRQVAEQDRILKSGAAVDEIIRNETLAIREKFGSPRRAHLSVDFSTIVTADVVADKKVVILFLTNGTVRAMSADDYEALKRRTSANERRVPDGVVSRYVAKTSSRDTVMLFTDQGNRYCLDVSCLPLEERARRPRPLSEYVDCAKNERVIAVTKNRIRDDESLLILSRSGLLARLAAAAVNSARCDTVSFYPEKVAAVMVARGDEDVVMVSAAGKVHRISLANVRVMKTRGSGGVQTLMTRDDDVVVAMFGSDVDMQIVTITTDGHCKRTALCEFPTKGRRGQGIQGAKGRVVYAGAVTDTDQETTLEICTSDNVAWRVRCGQVPEMKRNSAGVLLRKMKAGEEVTSVVVD